MTDAELAYLVLVIVAFLGFAVSLLVQSISSR
jgi:hypothetical protein